MAQIIQPVTPVDLIKGILDNYEMFKQLPEMKTAIFKDWLAVILLELTNLQSQSNPVFEITMNEDQNAKSVTYFVLTKMDSAKP
jgi:hypothetical protein